MGETRHPLVGTVVASVAGRDRHRVFVVTDVLGDNENMRLAVVNGRLHTASRPKLKNPRHVRPIGHLTDAERDSLFRDFTDGNVREILASYDPRANENAEIIGGAYAEG